MATVKITDFALYRWRYWISFSVVAGLVIVLLASATFISPGGVSKAEMDSAVTSTFTALPAMLGQSPDSILHLPYHLLQKLSLAAAKVTLIGIKLPSLLMAVGSMLTMYGLLRLWFRRNVAIIGSVITLVTGQFLMAAQLGTPSIGYIFWNAAILYSVSMLARTEKYRSLWLIAAAALAGFSMYSPLQIYIVIALLATSIIHPHARFLVFKLPMWVLGVSVGVFAIITLPLVISLLSKPHILLTLLGIPHPFALPTLHGLKQQFLQYFGFYIPQSGIQITPIYGLAVVALGIVGIYHLLSAKYTAKSYIVTIWLVLLFPAIIINSETVMIAFIPAMLLVAYGVDFIIRSWYRLFPNNPYARVFGLVPISVLLIGMMFSGFERFIYGYHYDPRANSVFSNDLQLINKVVDANKGSGITIVVPKSQRKFYTIYAERKHASPAIIVTSDVAAGKNSVVIVSRELHATVPGAPSTILVGKTSENADRFYLYKTPTK